MRRLATLVSLLALVLVSAAAAAGEANPRAAKERLNPRDTALARAATPTRADLGRRWRGQKLGTVRAAACKSFSPDRSRFTITGRARALLADSRGSSVQALVEVYASKKQAADDFEAAARPGQAGCLREALAAARRAATGVTLTVESARMLDAPKVGDRAAAYRLVGSMGSRGVAFPLYLDLLVVQRGRMVLSLLFTGLEQPVADRAQLGRKLAARMR